MKLKPLYKPKKEPMKLAIFMSGSGSNARKIIEKYIEQKESGTIYFEPIVIFTDNLESNALKIVRECKENGIMLPYIYRPIKEFYKAKKTDNLKDMTIREEYDSIQKEFLEGFGVETIALAGYDWVITSIICNNFLTINVHPGDLRVKDENGKRKYIGLGWIPSAKAILNGKNKVYTSVHLVTTDLDGGPLLAVSAPQNIQKEVLSLEDRTKLLGKAKSLYEISDFIEKKFNLSDEELYIMFPIYKFASECQEKLKVNGDWIEFPKVVENIAKGRYVKDINGNLYFDGRPIPNGVVNEEVKNYRVK